MLRIGLASALLVSMLAVACAASGSDTVATPTVSRTAAPATASPPASPSASPTAGPSPMPTTRSFLRDTRVTHLTIPSLAIDAGVQGSQVVPDTSPAPPGCPPEPEGRETLTVPNHGIATPEEAFEGLEHKAWIYGHSRWQNVPGVLFALQDIAVGDELFVDGFDRQTGDAVTNRRFVVEGIYLTDTDSGATLVTADTAAEIPTEPTVILQTSARASGANKQWLLNRARVLAKATNLVEGDIDDPCKYLLLFVIARAS